MSVSFVFFVKLCTLRTEYSGEVEKELTSSDFSPATVEDVPLVSGTRFFGAVSGAEFSAHPYLLNPYLVATDLLGLSLGRRDTWFFWEKREPDPQSLHLNFCFRFCAEAAQRICVVCV